MGKLFRFQLASCERCKRGERDSFSIERQFLKLVNIFSLSATKAVMWWRLGMARRIQALIFLLSHRLDTSRHFSANFLVILDHIRLLSSTDCFGGKCFALNPNNSLQILSKPLVFLSYQVFFTRTHIALANAVYHQCLQRRRPQALFNLPLHHSTKATVMHVIF